MEVLTYLICAGGRGERCVSVLFKLGLENSRAPGLVVQWTRYTRDQRDVSSQQEIRTSDSSPPQPPFFWNLLLSGLRTGSHLHSSSGPAFASGPLFALQPSFCCLRRWDDSAPGVQSVYNESQSHPFPALCGP